MEELRDRKEEAEEGAIQAGVAVEEVEEQQQQRRLLMRAFCAVDLGEDLPAW